jgi:NADH-quinone oxidoreductase subunit J
MIPVFAAGFPEAVLFWPLAILSVGSALAVLLARNPIYAAMGLVLSFFAVAGIYVLLAAQMLAALQVIVYAGAIMVLFLFVIMLLSLGEADLGEERGWLRPAIGAVVAGVTGGLIVSTFVGRTWESLPAAVSEQPFGTVAQVGRLLFGPFILPFEATSILLLVAIVGAVVVAKAKI